VGEVDKARGTRLNRIVAARVLPAGIKDKPEVLHPPAADPRTSITSAFRNASASAASDS
jgi:hypothetical protein